MDDEEFQSDDAELQGPSDSGEQGVQGEAGYQGEAGIDADPAALDEINARLDKHAQLADAMLEMLRRIDGILVHLWPLREKDEAVASGTSAEYLLTQNGGAAGVNQTSACTFTYDIYDAVSDPGKTNKLNLAGPLSLAGYGNGWRGLLIALSAATTGRGYQNLDGTFTLTVADEKPAGEQDCGGAT